MGNCLKRNRANNKNSQDYFMGFRIVTVEKSSEASNLLSRCKKRKSSKQSGWSFRKSQKSTKENANSIFEYEEPLNILDDKEVCGFLTVDKEEGSTQDFIQTE